MVIVKDVHTSAEASLIRDNKTFKENLIFLQIFFRSKIVFTVEALSHIAHAKAKQI